MKTNNNRRRGILTVVLVFAIVGLMTLVHGTFSEKAVKGGKNISVEVIGNEKEAVRYELSTNQEYLLGALQEIEELEMESEDGPYGPMLLSINGEFAEFNTNGAYWAFYVNDGYCNYGVAEQPVEDGDAFQIVYTPAE
ncbi:MAG: DUF4430 domain-containing protein [Lachnospiraceae bacterium]|nr:DUF4430 domain-containing protein [Lachnospiraceae bacterium]